MKKISIAYRLWLLRKSKYPPVPKHEKRKRKQPHGAKRKYLRGSNKGVITAPKNFVLLSQDYKNGKHSDSYYFLDFIKLLRYCSHSQITLDLSAAQKFTVEATLLFKAELEYLVTRKRTQIKCIPPKSDRARQVFCQTGIEDFLNIKYDRQTTRSDVVDWRHVSGAWNFLRTGLLDVFHDEIEKLNVNSASIYAGINEAINNCIEHAYKEHEERRIFNSDEQTGWWLFKEVKDDKLRIAVCDIGIGISKALPLKLKDEPDIFKKIMHIVARLSKHKDVQAIYAAIEYGRSSTNEAPRGKGLRDAHKVINDAGQGVFALYSNQGVYVYERKRNHTRSKVRHFTLHSSMRSTIYSWSLSLPTAADLEHREARVSASHLGSQSCTL